MWGVGLAGGYVLAFGLWPGGTPSGLQGAPGFWAAATAGLVIAAVALGGVLAWVLRRFAGEATRARTSSAPPLPVADR
jgi:MATE family multidrug resistance protein